MRLHHRIAQAFGYDLIHVNRNHPTIESHLKRLLAHLEINLVIDVGGNTGQFGRMLRETGYKGRIASFEPIPDCCRAITSIADDRWEVHPFALGAETGTQKLHVTRASAFTSFLPPSEYASKIRAQQVPVVDELEVPVKRLDDIFDSLIQSVSHLPPRVFLKMDTQGYDIEVFKGAGRCLDNIAGLQSEISIVPLYDGMPDYVSALSVFREAGFEITGLYPVTRDYDTFFLVEMDCVMKKKTESF